VCGIKYNFELKKIVDVTKSKISFELIDRAENVFEKKISKVRFEISYTASLTRSAVPNQGYVRNLKGYA